jgi:3-oxoacyl-[acyl-carrier-protein] synthase II
MKVVSMACNDTPSVASRRSTGDATGSCSAKARGCVLEREDPRARAAPQFMRLTATPRRATRATVCRWRRTAKSFAPTAIERSGHPVESIGYVSYHGTSTVLNDAVESRCVRQVFGAAADRLAARR